MAMASLPSELLASVFAHLPSDSLRAVALVCNDCRTEAQRLLFRHISVAPAHRNLHVVHVLARSPHLAALVRTFWLSLPPTDDEVADGPSAGAVDAEPGGHTGPHAALLSALADALAGMTTLHALTLLVDPRAGWVLARAPAQPQLAQLTCTFPLRVKSVSAFLARTPALRVLELESVPGAGDAKLASGAPCASAGTDLGLPSVALPRLASFTGSPSSARALVPGRPVHTVHLLCGAGCVNSPAHPSSVVVDDSTQTLLDALAHSTSPNGVEMLTLTTSCSAVPFLDALGRSLPYLVNLRVGTSYAFDGPWDAEFYDRVADALAAMPALRTFELSGMCWPCARCAGRDDSDAPKHGGWRPTNLPLVPAPLGPDVAGGIIQPDQAAAQGEAVDVGLGAAVDPDPEDGASPVPEFDFHDYLF